MQLERMKACLETSPTMKSSSEVCNQEVPNWPSASVTVTPEEVVAFTREQRSRQLQLVQGLKVYNKTTVDVKGFACKRRLWVNKERPTRTEVQAAQKSRNLADNEEQLRSLQINYHLPGRYVTRAMMKTDGRKWTG